MQVSSAVSLDLDRSAAECFHVLPNSNLSITFRFLHPGDQPQVKSLCREWFPVEYPDAWYDDIVYNDKYFSLAACDLTKEHILGLIVATVLPLGTCNREDQQILHKVFADTTSVCYILTLGVVKEYRRQGLAHLLLDKLLQTLAKHDTCKAVYLHVLHSNKQAIQFYRSKSFQYRTHLPYYYLIKGEYFDAFCFARYINGGYPPFTLADLYANFWRCLSGSNPCHLLNTIRYFVTDKFFSVRINKQAALSKRLSHIV